jgi:hypothetical protein
MIGEMQMRDNLLFSFLGVWLLVMCAAGNQIIGEYGIGKYAIMCIADVLMLMGLVAKVESEE